MSSPDIREALSELTDAAENILDEHPICRCAYCSERVAALRSGIDGARALLDQPASKPDDADTEHITVTFSHHKPTDSWSYTAAGFDVGAFTSLDEALDDFNDTRWRLTKAYARLTNPEDRPR